MFPRSMPLLDVFTRVGDVSLHAGSSVTFEYVAVLGERCLIGRDFSSNFLVLIFDLWCCIDVPSTRSFQCFLSKWC